MACRRTLEVPQGQMDSVLIYFTHLPLDPEMSRMAGNQPILGGCNRVSADRTAG
jgi:hypothetical protein